MDVYNFLKSFIGIPNSVPPNDFNSERFKDYVQDGHDNLFRHDSEPEEGMTFHIFSNPLTMHRYFEGHMNELLKSLGLPSDGAFFGNFFDQDQPTSDTPHSSSSNLRDHYLKPGYENPVNKSRSDSDVDGKVNLNDLDDILKTNETTSVAPYIKPSAQPQIRFFGQSMSTKTVVKPDGTVETHRTVKDNQGNEETTVTCKNGDSEYTITTRTDRDGKQTREEKFVNLDEKDVSRLQPSMPLEPGQPFDFRGFFK